MPEKPNHSDLENGALKKNIFSTPEGYFDSLHNNILEKIHTVDDNSIERSEHLNKNIYTVPEGYFESLASTIEEKTFGKETKVVPLFSRSWIKYVAAAAIVFLAVFLVMRPGSSSGDRVLADLSDEVILEYLLDDQISSLDMIASIDGAEMALNEMIEEEMGSFNIQGLDNPELEYDFEYIEY